MTPEILIVCIILAVMIILFVTEIFRVDVIAVIIMLSIGWLGLTTPAETFSGFASNAVISIIAVMILGYGIDSTGIMINIARKIVLLGGSEEKKITGIISSCVGIISAFIQNIGSAALFLPAILRISKKTKIPRSRLIMPMGFSAIIGGTLSMVGSSPLILLNDLLIQGELKPFDLFAVTPIGICLLISGIVYFLLLGKYVLPDDSRGFKNPESQESLIDTWNLPKRMYHYVVTEDSSIIGMKRDDLKLNRKYSLFLIAIKDGKDMLYAPWRYTVISKGQILTILGSKDDALSFKSDYNLKEAEDQNLLDELTSEENAGFAEIILRPRSKIAGKKLSDLSFRLNYGLEVIVYLSREGERRNDFSNIVLNTGDSFVVYGSWESIKKAGTSPDFILLTPPGEKTVNRQKAPVAILCFLGGILLSFTGAPISFSLLTGALFMVIFGVLSIDEAYRAVDWRTVFLLAGLIPFGIAMEKTGTASFIADTIVGFMGGGNPLFILIAVAFLATFFSLFMSNVAATVILVPLVILIGIDTGVSPRGLALLVGICASNSFILPTHQVNAFLMGQGGYNNRDYLRAGGIMTLIFISVSVGLIYILFV